MNGIAISDIESILPVFVGLGVFFLLIGLKLRKTILHIYFERKTSKDKGLYQEIYSQNRTFPINITTVETGDKIESLKRIGKFLERDEGVAVWKNNFCFGKNFRIEIMARWVYDNSILDGKLIGDIGLGRFLSCGAGDMGVCDLSRAAWDIKLMGSRLNSDEAIQFFTFDNFELRREMSKFSKNSGVILSILPNPNVEIKMIQ